MGWLRVCSIAVAGIFLGTLRRLHYRFRREPLPDAFDRETRADYFSNRDPALEAVLLAIAQSGRR